MDIRTKFNVCECVYLVYRGNIEEVEIEEIITVSEKVNGMTKVSTAIHYKVGLPDKIEGTFNEADLLKTKKAAVRELIKKNGYAISEDDLIEI